MNIAITGASGFVAQVLAHTFMRHHQQPLLISRAKNTIIQSLPQRQASVTDLSSLIKATSGVEVLIHTVGIGSLTDYSPKAKQQYNRVNVTGTANVLKACQKNKIKHLIYLSSLAAQGLITNQVVTETTSPRPTSPYERSKLKSEQVLINSKSTKVTILRPAMIFGPTATHSELFTLAKLVSLGLCPIFGSGTNHMPMVFVDDVTRLITHLTTSLPHRSETYNLTYPKAITYNQLIRSLKKLLNPQAITPHFPVPLLTTLLAPLEFLAKPLSITLPVTRARLQSITADRRFNVTKAIKELNFTTTPLVTALTRTLKPHYPHRLS